MAKNESESDRERAYIVIARTGSTGKKYEDCQVIPHGEPYLAIYSQVFGPAGRRECDKWANSNCGKSGAATE